MADFPAAIFVPRTVANLPGITYDAAKTTTEYAEDYSLPAAEIAAIEATLGENPQGSFGTVAERLAAGGGGRRYALAASWFLMQGTPVTAGPQGDTGPAGPSAPVAGYAATVSDVGNTTAEGDLVSWVVPAGEMADGDVIEMTCTLLSKNNKGSSGYAYLTVHCGAGSSGFSAQNAPNSASERLSMGKLVMQRVGTTLYIFNPVNVDSIPMSRALALLWDTGGPAYTITGVDFSGSLTMRLTTTLSAAHVTFYAHCVAARVLRIGAPL